ncbi:recombinase family protein [Streptomyces sp. ODS28]|uniref:recombinase family protein n=1 Tax=Streptomyces sp. ODS28 TaxID=3136688 RepID=UPI0031EB5696
MRTILINPRYTGYEVWNKQRKQESLLDVDNVALGHQTKLIWNGKDSWVFSDRPTHPPLVSKDIFKQVQQRLASRGPASQGRTRARVQHPYVFKGMVLHHECRRRMQGNWLHDEAYYRCRFPQEYAVANKVDHPLNVCLRESSLIGPVDE